MSSFNYYEFAFRSAVAKKKNSDNWNGARLYSKVAYDSPEYIGNILFFPSNNDQYSAHQRIPSEEIIFYDYAVDTTQVKVLDDFMSCVEINAAFGFFVSPRLKDLLSDFLLPAHNYYPVTLQTKQQAYPYYFLLLAREGLKINYAQSVFVERFDKSVKANVNNDQDLLLRKEGGPHGAHYVSANVREKVIAFDEAPDIYPITRGDGWFYFSEALKTALETANITGFHCHEQSSIAFILASQK